MLVVRRQHIWRVGDCKVISGEHVATQHKPQVFVVRIQKKRKDKVVGLETIKRWTRSRHPVVAYKERLTLDYYRIVEEE